MAPLDTIKGIVRDESDKQASKRWHAHLLSEKIRGLRFLRHLTQAEVANRMGVSESAVRNYELMKALPNEEHINLMAKAFDVRPECLRLYDFGVSSVFANSLFQLADVYSLAPYQDEGFTCLKPTNAFMQKFFGEWNYQYAGLRDEKISRESYELWKDCYVADYNPQDFPSRFECGKDQGSYELIPSWEAHCFSRKIKGIREALGVTQAVFSARIGVKEGVYRSYEHGRRLPRRSVIRGIADALDVTEGSLTFFDFGTPVQSAHALFQLASDRGLIPELIDGEPILRARERSIEKVLDQWCTALDGNYESAGWEEIDGFETWKDKYDPDGPGPSEWMSRFTPHGIKQDNGSLLLDGGYGSDFDPVDERYKNGYLKA